MSKRKKVPKFHSEEQERRFWARTDSTEYVDWSRAKRVVLPELKPSQRTISLRLPAMMLAELKRLAHKRDVPYQSLLKVFVAERLAEEALVPHLPRHRIDQRGRGRSVGHRRGRDS